MNFDAINVRWADLLKRSANAWVADKTLRLSAALAYYSASSIVGGWSVGRLIRTLIPLVVLPFFEHSLQRRFWRKPPPSSEP